MLPFKRLVSPILKSEACTSCLTQCVFCLCLCNCFPSGTQAESTAGNPGGLELNNKKNQVSVGIRNCVFWTIFHKFLSNFSRFHHIFVNFHDFFPTFSSNGHPGASSGESFNGFSNIMPGSQGQSVSEYEQFIFF